MCAVRHRLQEGIQKDRKLKGRVTVCQASARSTEAGVTAFIFDKVDLK